MEQHTRSEHGWRVTHETLASSVYSEGVVSITNIRDFRYPSKNEDAPVREFRGSSFPLTQVESVWIAVIPFRPHFAHLITSFGMQDGTYIAISIEIRYRKDEPYVLWKTFYPHYWLSYIIATEDDVFRIRTDIRHNEPVHLYRLTLTPDVSQTLFLDMILRAQKINHESPERFHSVWNSCTSNVLAHLGHVLGKKLPISRAHYLTDTLDTYLAQHGLLDLKEPYSRTVRTLHCINEIAKTIPQNAIDFSSRIRL